MSESAAAAEPIPDVELTKKEVQEGLFAAAKLGRKGLVVRCLAKGADPNAADARGWQALHYAAYYGHHRVVEALLKDKEARDAASADALNNTTAVITEGGGGAKEISTTTSKCWNSPLSWAVLRGHVKCVWALITAGYSVLDVDQCGNNALHLCCASVTPAENVQYEMMKTIMTAGFDPDARNWLGQRAIDMLPVSSLNSDAGSSSSSSSSSSSAPSHHHQGSLQTARGLLEAALEQTKCFSTGTPFGADQLRYLCNSSLKFYCEAASISQMVPALAPSLPGITTPYLHHSFKSISAAHYRARKWASKLPLSVEFLTSGDSHKAPPLEESVQERKAQIESELNEATKAAAAEDPCGKYGFFHGVGGILLASDKSDSNLQRPVRFGAEVSYKVADAETTLESSLNPFFSELEAALDEFEAAVIAAEPVPLTVSSSTGDAANSGEKEGGEEKKSEEEEEELSEEEKAARAAAAAAAAKAAAEAAFIERSRRIRSSFDFPIEAVFSPFHYEALESAVNQCRLLHGDLHLTARGMAALKRLDAAKALKEAMVLINKRRPLKTTSIPTILDPHSKEARKEAIMMKESPSLIDPLRHADDCIFTAERLGVGPLFINTANQSLRAAAAEIELNNAIEVASAIPVATHYYDSDILRLQDALTEARAVNTVISNVNNGPGDTVEDELQREQDEAESKAKEILAAREQRRLALEAEKKEKERLEALALEAALLEGGNAEAAGVGAVQSGGEVEAAAAPVVPAAAASESTTSSDGDAANDALVSAATGLDDLEEESIAKQVKAPRAPNITAHGILIIKDNLIPLLAIAESLISTGQALLDRLNGEVRVMDAVEVVNEALAVVTETVEKHKDEDPAYLPFFEKPIEVGPDGQPLPPPAPLPPNADGTPAPRPNLDWNLPCDINGIPLPDSPQVLSLKALRDTVIALESAISVGKTAGADAKCISSSEVTLTTRKSELNAGLIAESQRVEFFRSERAKAEKKNKKKGGKK
jgi:hypothetical protein